jgi:beta-lactamase class A
MTQDRRLWSRCLLLTTCITLALVAAPASRAAATPGARKSGVYCVSRIRKYVPLAKRMARDLDVRLDGRFSDDGIKLTDSKTRVTCWYHSHRHFLAASVIKVTILSALLRKAQQEHRHLTTAEKDAAWLMITQSDNDAANQLWFDVGLRFMQHFLNLAKMSQTKLNYAWGLTLITARDEMTLLSLISGPNKVLTKASRMYVRHLMAHVIAGQRWGVPAGTPRGVRVHVKNGWLPYPGTTWEINSIGTFTTKTRTYLIAMLTYGNPSMAYGVDTIEDAARVIQALLNPGKRAAVLPSAPSPSWGIPDESIARR